MIFKKSQSLRSYVNGIQAKTLMIFCDDCHAKAQEIPLDNVSVLTQTGLDFIDSDHDTTDFLKKILTVGGFDQIILVCHFPCLVHRHLKKGLKTTSKWEKLAHRTRINYLKLEDDGIRHLSEREFSLIHLQQQLTFFRELILQETRESENIYKPILKGLLSDNKNQVHEVEIMDVKLHLN